MKYVSFTQGSFLIILYYTLFLHYFCLIMIPFIILFISKSSNGLKLFRSIYIYIYILIRFLFNILRHTMVYHMVITRHLSYYILRYLFFFQICTFLPYLKLLLLTCGDIESNPGPENIGDHNLSICHWNLNGLATNEFIKLSLLEAYNTVHDFDIICISETFMNSEISTDDPRLSLQGYTMI